MYQTMNSQTKPKPKLNPNLRTKPSGLREDESVGSKKGFFNRLFSRRSAEKSNAQTIRAIADDSMVFNDRQHMEDIKDKRLQKLTQMKDLKKVTVNGEKRYVKKDQNESKTRSTWSKIKTRVKSLLGIKQKMQTKNRLEAQCGRDDTSVTEVNKRVGKQPVALKRDIQRDPFDIIATRKAGNGHRWRDPIECQARCESAAHRQQVLFGSILYDMAVRDISRIDCEFLYELQFGKRKVRPSEELRLQMQYSVRRSAHLLKDNKIKDLRYLAKGGQAFVFSAILDPKGIVKKVALKLSIDENDPNFKKEMDLLRKLRHKNIIDCVDVGPKIMAMEFAESDLREWIGSQFLEKQEMLSLESVRILSIELLSGLKYIHNRGLVHNDLKLFNILVVIEPNGRFRPKITDFGHSKHAFRKVDGKRVLIESKWSYGTPLVSPPECFEGLIVKDVRLTDVWAFGIVVFKLITYHYPYYFRYDDTKDEKKLKQILKMLKKETLFDDLLNTEDISEAERQELRTVLKRLLNPDVSKRESIETIGKDKWFEAVRREGSYQKSRTMTTRNKYFAFDTLFNPHLGYGKPH